MATDEEHPLIAFAGTYSNPQLDYLNAYMAIMRLEALIEDLAKVSDLLEADCPEERRWAPWFGAEAMSYYAVGYVTCLEWHAKSRLVDLLTFRPSALKVADVQRTITDKLIVQMVAKQASVVQLVGAALKIGSLDVYLAVFNRVFQELAIPCKISEWLAGSAPDSTVCWIKPERLATIDLMFEFRHTLVHEIGFQTMGHPNVRDAWSPADARSTGGLVASLMCGIEAALTKYAPELFPNRLTEDRWPVGSVQTLSAEYGRLDALADTAIRAAEWDHNNTAEKWQVVREAFAQYVAAEESFVDTAGMLHWRYFDARTPLRLKLYRYRIEFLTDLLSHFGAEETEEHSLAQASDAITEES